MARNNGQRNYSICIALPLPEETECSICEKGFDELSITKLKIEEGVETLAIFFDDKFKMRALLIVEINSIISRNLKGQKQCL